MRVGDRAGAELDAAGFDRRAALREQRHAEGCDAGDGGLDLRRVEVGGLGHLVERVVERAGGLGGEAAASYDADDRADRIRGTTRSAAFLVDEEVAPVDAEDVGAAGFGARGPEHGVVHAGEAQRGVGEGVVAEVAASEEHAGEQDRGSGEEAHGGLRIKGGRYGA